MNDINTRYKLFIHNKVKDLINADKNFKDFDNFDLAKIFEYYSCIKLSEEFKKPFYEYSDIDPEFKEEHNLTKNDSGIDASNLIDTIVQCKLRKNNLSWKECSTFFASQNIYCEKQDKTIVKWKNLIITRNKDCELSDNLKYKKKLFLDRTFDKKDILEFCKTLYKNPPKIEEKKEKIIVRDYQQKAIDLIKNMKRNLMINLPTGTGKNFILAHAINPLKYSYLILVPRIILLEQIEEELKKYKENYQKYIQKIGDGNNNYDKEKSITICVYNSVEIIEKYIKDFDFIIVDEAHHIMKPEIYMIDEEEYSDEDEDETEDETEDESESEDEDKVYVNNKTYINIIKSYQKYNNNVYLSATIDKTNSFDYYSKDLREMIDSGYLCDYNIKIPIFTDDPTNTNICKYLVKNYRNIIVYCNSQKEGITINKILNKIQKNCSAYIDCNTSYSVRNKILKKYKSGDLPFLVNVRILVEGFDAPITKGICFMHMPSSKTTLIQIIGRALRLHKDKTSADIIIPFSDKDDEDSINNFMKTMARNDSRIRKSYMNKKLGGYIDIFNGEDLNEDEIDEEESNQIELKYELIFDKLGNLKNYQEIWELKLESVKKYIDLNKKRPSQHDKDVQIKTLGEWITNQIKNYNKEKYIMSNEDIRNKWERFLQDTKYKQYFK